MMHESKKMPGAIPRAFDSVVCEMQRRTGVNGVRAGCSNASIRVVPPNLRSLSWDGRFFYYYSIETYLCLVY